MVFGPTWMEVMEAINQEVVLRKVILIPLDNLKNGVNMSNTKKLWNKNKEKGMRGNV